MSMKIRAITAAVAAVTALTASVASAVHDDATPGPFPIPFGTTYDARLYASSATALRDSIKGMFATYCSTAASAVHNIYELDTTLDGIPSTEPNWAGLGLLPGDSANIRAYECRFTNTVSDPEYAAVNAKGLADARVLLQHTVKVNEELGGSILGVMPIYRNIPILYVTPNASCTANGHETISGVTFNKWKCPNATWQPSDIGASDVEPDVFTGLNLSSALIQDGTNGRPMNDSINTPAEVSGWASGLTALEKGLVTSRELFAVGFGIAANTTLATALNGVGGGLNRDQVASILAGNVEYWGQLFPQAPAAFANAPVKVCRRTAGSGTQASYNAYFNRAPCDGSLALSVATPANTGQNGDLLVKEGAASSDVRTCLTENPAAYAIGNLTLESLPTAGWTFVKLDGVNALDVAGDVATNVNTFDGEADGIREDLIVRGTYPFYMEPTIQWKNSMTDIVGNKKLSLALLLAENGGNPVITNQLRGIMSPASWWTRAPYSTDIAPADGIKDARALNALNATGIMEFTRTGRACRASVYIP